MTRRPWYLVVGKTHPELVRREGEAYRRQLWQLVKDRGLEQHVDFVDEYLTQAQIVDYLLASDIYVTPYLDPQQITRAPWPKHLGQARPSSRRPTRTLSRCWQMSADSWCRFAVR